MECGDCSSHCCGSCIGFKAFDIPPKCRSAFFSSGICQASCNANEALTTLSVNIALRPLRNVGVMKIFVYLPSAKYVFVQYASLSARCNIDM